jgi:hypothetical protein
MTTTTAAVLAEIAAERTAQDAKWGPQNHIDGTREYGHYDQQTALAAKAACQLRAGAGCTTWRAILWEEVAEAFAEEDPALLRAELVQVAAVAAAWIEAIDRRTNTTAAVTA